MIGDHTCDPRILNQDYEKWERPYLDRAICYKELKDNQSNYLMFCGNYDLKELIDIRPVQGSVYIKSACEPFDLEMTIDWNRVKNWIDHFGMGINNTHVSGHASSLHLKEFVEQVNAKTVIPIHTENAGAFTKWSNNVKSLKGIGDSFSL
jgi:ribonuclease J